MLKKTTAIVLVASVVASSNTVAYAKVGDMGFFSGISQGRRLPKTSETMLDIQEKKSISVPYKEMIMIDKTPVEFDGILTYNTTEKTELDKEADRAKTLAKDPNAQITGKYKDTYTLKASNSNTAGGNITRNVTFDVNYYEQGEKVIKDYTVSQWTETLTTKTATYTIDPAQSFFELSIVEDHKPGVTYSKGDISMVAVYTGGKEPITVTRTGTIYGYTSAWSSTETHRIDTIVQNGQDSIMYQSRPSVSVSKKLDYSDNEPTLISFDGNYREVMYNESGEVYDYLFMPPSMYLVDKSGSINIQSYNSFEQLIPADLSYLKGHWAYDDIQQLYSIGVLSGDVAYYQPSQAITRAEYTTMLVKAIKLPVDKSVSNSNSKVTNIIFPDVTKTRKDYPYIIAAYNNGLAKGRANGHYYPDSKITREEAIVILLRTIGLENLGLNPTPMTSFVDDSQISDWAKREVYAANRIGLITPDSEGKLNPQDYVSKAEASVFVNRLIEYMREDMKIDYTENIVNYTN